MLRRFSTKNLKEALENGPKFEDFITGKSVESVERVSVSVPGDGRLPKWLKTPIAVGERYTHLKETLRDLKLHTVRSEVFISFINFLRCVRRLNVLILEIVGTVVKQGKQQQQLWLGF